MDAEFVDTIGQLFTDSFAILRFLENGFNWFIIGVGLILMVVWVKKMFDYNKEADHNGTLR